MSDDVTAEQASGVLGWFPDVLPAGQRVIALFTAKWTIGALRALVQLNVPDLLAAGPRTAEDLATATGTHADALYRVLVTAATGGVFDQLPDGRFAAGPFSDGLRSDVPNSAREMFLFACDPMLWRPYEDVLHTVKTGEPSFDKVFGMSFYDYVKENPASGALFDRAMTQNHYPGTDRILEQFGFDRFARIADVGGGKGQFLADVLVRFPEATGVLCDQPHVVAEAKEIFAAAGVADRVQIVDTDFFTEVPSGCNAYMIKHALHNWNDDKAEQILRTIRTAMGDDPDARLLIVDMLLTGYGEWDMGKLTDIEMLVALGGRERDRQGWNRLLDAAGFVPANEPVPGDLAILEYRAR